MNEYGRMVEEEWLRTGELRSEIQLDQLVVMPNHIHALLFIDNLGQRSGFLKAHGRAPLRLQPRSLGAVVAGYKSSVTKRVNELRSAAGAPVWQRNYFERVVRNEDELARIREYIVSNPTRWADDEHNPANIKKKPSTNVGAHRVRSPCATAIPAKHVGAHGVRPPRRHSNSSETRRGAWRTPAQAPQQFQQNT